MMSVLDSFLLNGKIAMVTGGNRGLGRAAVRALAEVGATVVLTCREQERADTAAQELSAETGGRCVGYALDVRDGGAVNATVARVIEELGGAAYSGE